MITVALTGTPNVGKSTLFNVITGLKQHVGNWPGKTIEQKTGSVTYGGTRLEISDLPGAYSLTSVSPEEQVARDHLLFGSPDVIGVVVDAAQLERGLSFLSEVLALGCPVVVALNMVDVCEHEGIMVDAGRLAKVLGLPVVAMVARRNQGVAAFLAALVAAPAQKIADPAVAAHPLDPIWPELSALIAPGDPELRRRFVAQKVCEGDVWLRLQVEERLDAAGRERLRKILIAHEDVGLRLGAERHQWVDEVCHRIGYHTRGVSAFHFTDRLDRFAAHPWWGLAIFCAVVYGLFGLVFGLGTPLQGLLDKGVITPLSHGLVTHFPGSFWARLVAEGLIGGVGLVLSFVPVLALFFLGMAFLEDVGYMTRAAFVMDRFMHRMGLHGRSFVPMFMGMGCNVPAMMATRVIDDRASRLLTMMLVPMVPCSARLAVIAFFGAAFFAAHNALFSWAMIFLPIFTLALLGIVLSRTLFKGQQMPLIMELPLYHLPNLKGILVQTWVRTRVFIKQAGGIIALFALGVWLLSYHPSGDVGLSPIGRLGHRLDPVAAWFGSDWRMLVALMTSFIVKENTIATLSILTHVTTEADTLTAIRAVLTPAGALAFMVVQMLFVPCVSTLVMFKKESGSWRWPLAGMGLQAAVSLVCGVILFQVMRFLG